MDTIKILRDTLDFLSDDHFTVGCYAVNARNEPTPFLQQAARVCTVGGLMRLSGVEQPDAAHYANTEPFGSALLAVADVLEPDAERRQCHLAQRAYEDERNLGYPSVLLAEEYVAHASDVHGLAMIRPALEAAVEASGVQTESEYLDELNRGYAQDSEMSMDLLEVRNKIADAISSSVPGLHVWAKGCGDGVCDIAFDLEGTSYSIGLGLTKKDREDYDPDVHGVAYAPEENPLVAAVAANTRALYMLAAAHEMHSETSLPVWTIKQRADALQRIAEGQ